MENIIASLRIGCHGREVNALNKCLGLLLEKGSILNMDQPYLALNTSQLKELINENAEQFGTFTRILIRLFQQKQHLPETGEVDERTAFRLNAILNGNNPAHQQTPYSLSNDVFTICWPETKKVQLKKEDFMGYHGKLAGSRILNHADPVDSETLPDTILTPLEKESNTPAPDLLRLSVKGGEYTYARANDILMIESSDHLTVVHVAQYMGKVKTSLRNSCLKKILLELPKGAFTRVNRFCAINLNRISGGSFHHQFFEFDHCIKVKPRHPLSHAVFHAIGK